MDKLLSITMNDGRIVYCQAVPGTERQVLAKGVHVREEDGSVTYYDPSEIENLVDAPVAMETI